MESNFIATLVGESNPYGSSPEFALYPAPQGCSGQRLCDLVMSVDRDLYVERYERVNLCDGPWRIGDARRRAADLLSRSKLVLLGAKICSAFGYRFNPFTAFASLESKQNLILILPHPSGLSRAWMEPGAFGRARSLLAQYGYLPPVSG